MSGPPQSSDLNQIDNKWFENVVSEINYSEMENFWSDWKSSGILVQTITLKILFTQCLKDIRM